MPPSIAQLALISNPAVVKMSQELDYVPWLLPV